MARPSVLVVPLLLATFIAIAHAQDAPASPPPPTPAAPSSWTTVGDANDPTIRQVGQLAVRIYALRTAQPQLAFVNVVGGQTQPYAGGFNYRLVVTVAAGGKTAQYNAFIWGILRTRSWRLWSFTPVH
ncbi:hypothetical protein ACP4OV_015788 [Aristida adscensionis]